MKQDEMAVTLEQIQSSLWRLLRTPAPQKNAATVVLQTLGLVAVILLLAWMTTVAWPCPRHQPDLTIQPSPPSHWAESNHPSNR